MQQLDHIVYAVPNLEEAMNWFEEKAEVRPIFGGYHTTQGTKNALMKLGDNCYLELLAVDEENEQIIAPRWMGIDLLTSPKITRWALQSNNLKGDGKIVNAYNPHMGKITGGQRKKSDGKLLTWELTVPLAEPEVEILPFLIDWQHSESHPADGLKQYCSLVALVLTHPQPEQLQKVLEQLNVALEITRGAVSITATIQTPKGLLII